MTPADADLTPLLEARGVVKRFGAFTALNGVDFAVAPGEVHALLGENGAGKSTLMNVLSGLLRPTEGEIRRDGTSVAFTSPRDAERHGIGMVHQHFLLIPPLSVRENLLLGASADKGGPLSYPIDKVLAEASALADTLGWRIPWDKPAGDLPVGDQQRIEILKALRGETRVLIFDEPTAVLTPTETPELFQTIRRLAGEGRGIVFISHKLDEVLNLAQRVTVLRRGAVVHRTTTGETTAAGLAEAMVGKDSEAAGMLAASSPHPPSPSPRFAGGEGESIKVEGLSVEEDARNSQTPPLPQRSGERGKGGEGQNPKAALTVESLTLKSPARAGRPLLHALSFAVAPGEIYGIAGVDGNGQGELAECLSGLTRPDGGAIQIAGVAPASDPAAFRRAGVATIPADRHRQGLALPMSITENVAFGVYDDPAYRRGPLLLWGQLRERATDLIARFDIRATGPESPTAALSGGNQQKVVIARALSGDPKVVIAVNPTRGLDVGAIAYVHSALRAAQAAGAAIVLISTELDEVIALSTSRIAVLYEGEFSGIVAPDAPRAEIGLLMGGRTSERAAD